MPARKKMCPTGAFRYYRRGWQSVKLKPFRAQLEQGEESVYPRIR